MANLKDNKIQSTIGFPITMATYAIKRFGQALRELINVSPRQFTYNNHTFIYYLN